MASEGAGATPASQAEAETIEEEIQKLKSLSVADLRKKFDAEEEKYKEQMYVKATLERMAKQPLIREIHEILSDKEHTGEMEVQLATLPKYLTLYIKSIRYKYDIDEMGELLDAIQKTIYSREGVFPLTAESAAGARAGAGAGAGAATPKKRGRKTNAEKAAMAAAGILPKKSRKSEVLAPPSGDEEEEEE